MTEYKKKYVSEQLNTQQHNRVCKVIRWHIYKNFDIPVPENSWENEPKAITENTEVPSTHVRPNDPIEREHRKKSIATTYHTLVQKK